MSWELWLIIGIIAVVYFSWLIYEVKNAPLMPDDYDTPWEKITKDSNLKNENNKTNTN